jgi:hypothetical protein
VAPVYNAANDVFDRRNSKLDGTDPIVIGGFSYYLPLVGWSQDGKWISSVSWYTCVELCGELHVALADGAGTERYLDDATPGVPVSWGSNGRLAYEFPQTASSFQIHTSAPDGPPSFLHAGTAPDWSPASDRIVFGQSGIAVINADGNGFHNLTTAASDSNPKWSPDGRQILFSSRRDGNDEIYVMNTDGSGQTNLTNNPAADSHAIWSPDGRKIAFESNRDGATHIFVMNSNGSALVRVANDLGGDSLADWQRIPYTGYPRPRGAGPLQLALVPAYAPCTAPNRSHGAPLSDGSCAPPSETSGTLTTGTLDVNGQPAKMFTKVVYAARPGDLEVTATITDVRKKSDLSDYTGELSLSSDLRITDRNNTPGPDPATGQDTTLAVTIPCAATAADTTVGSSCDLATTVNSVYPGALVAGARAIWQMGPVKVYDGNGNLFLDQGLFVP